MNARPSYPQQNSATPVPKVLNPAIYSLLTTLIIWGVSQSGQSISPEGAAAIVGTGAAIVGYLSPRARK